MSTFVDGAEIALDPVSLLDIVDGQGLTIEALQGEAWLTQADDQRDIIVAPGHPFRLDRPGLALLTTLTGARLKVIDTRTVYETVARHATADFADRSAYSGSAMLRSAAF